MKDAKSVSRLLLALLLAAAGVLHLLRPELFDPAIPLPYKGAINIIVGVFECALAVGLLCPSLRDRAAQNAAGWFLALIPIHIYVSWHHIPMFEISHPALLWGRTLLQGVLYFWALSVQQTGWLISQRWSDVMFLHYEVAPQKLQEKVPFPLDLYAGKAIVSIVPFVMNRIRFPFLPPIPGLSRLIELNLRTYVKVNGVAGVYFFTLDSNHLPGVLVARWFFALPYRWVKLSLQTKGSYTLRSSEIDLTAKIGAERPATSMERWLTERYSLFTKRGDRSYEGIVEHAPWVLHDAEVIVMKDNFTRLPSEELKMAKLIAAAYAPKLDVRFRPFRRLP
jgi:uncharacterized protein YqjF (DUF2071 family)